MSAPQLIEHFFRHEYGRLVATLSCRVGVESVEDIEDAVQFALMAALEHWTVSGVPDNPSAWLFRVSSNNLLAALRTDTRRRRILQESGLASAGNHVDLPELSKEEVQRDMLRMLFVCCDDTIPVESQVVFALKTLCGFDVREISLRLFTSEANVYKRLQRARQRLQVSRPCPDALDHGQMQERLPGVHKVLYLLFTEGYLSSDAELPLRRELCDEAIRLVEILASHPSGQDPETYALGALMHLHIARLSGRQDGAGDLLLLEEQDRDQWDAAEIQKGMAWLAQSSQGETFSRYHAEAGIAAEHCLSPSFAETRWDRIAQCYELLEHSTQSPLHRLNRAVAVAQWKGPEEGLAILAGFQPPTWLAGSYQWSAVMADLSFRSERIEDAKRYRESALASSPSVHVTALLQRRLQFAGHD